jgi:hypothetical protein
MDEGRGRPNLLSIMTPSLHTDVRDPVERLRAIRDDTLGAKATTSALGKTTLTRIPMNLPAPVARNLYPLLVTLGVQSETLLFNTLISNVAIDHGPLYFSGAKLVKVVHGVPGHVAGSGILRGVHRSFVRRPAAGDAGQARDPEENPGRREKRSARWRSPL